MKKMCAQSTALTTVDVMGPDHGSTLDGAATPSTDPNLPGPSCILTPLATHSAGTMSPGQPVSLVSRVQPLAWGGENLCHCWHHVCSSGVLYQGPSGQCLIHPIVPSQEEMEVSDGAADQSTQTADPGSKRVEVAVDPVPSHGTIWSS